MNAKYIECVLQDLQSRNIPRISNECRYIRDIKRHRSHCRSSFPDLSASASVIIYNCELPARLVLITSHGYDHDIRTLITNYLTCNEPATTWRHRIACEIIGFDAHANVKTDTRPYVKSRTLLPFGKKKEFKRSKKRNY